MDELKEGLLPVRLCESEEDDGSECAGAAAVAVVVDVPAPTTGLLPLPSTGAWGVRVAEKLLFGVSGEQ